MFFVVDKPRLQRMIAITRDDRAPAQQGEDAPFFRIEARDGQLRLTGREVEATFPATVYEPGVLFLRVTLFRRMLRTMAGVKTLAIQVAADGLHFGDVKFGCLRELDAAITQYLDDHEDASGRWPDAIGVWVGCPVHDAVVAVETALGVTKLPDPALLYWKTLLRHCRDSTHWPQGWPPDELWASAKKLRAWAREQLDDIHGGQSGNVPIWSVALKMQEIAGVFRCEAKKRTVQPLLEAVGSDLKELPRRKYQVRLDRMDPAYHPAFEKKSGRG